MTDAAETTGNISASSIPKFAEWVWYGAAVIIVLLSGLPNLLFPFVADQIVPLSGAKVITQGGILYVDFWDNKMPGLFWFYQIAGELFGYSELGVHILELIWMSTFAVVLMVALRRYLFYPWLSAVVPAAVVAVYYVSAEPFLLTQLEILVGLPIFLGAWFVSRLPSSAKVQRRLSLASGICAGITVVFKLVFAPLFVVFWVIVSIDALSAGRSRFVAVVTNIWGPASFGVAAVLGIVVIKFWSEGALDELLWTAFEYPPEAFASAPPAPYSRLIESLRFFLTYYLAWSGFIVAAAIFWWRSDRELFTSLLIAWLIVGLGLIVIQSFSWWRYHFLILFPPAGILAVRGISELTRYLLNISSPPRINAMVLALAFVVPVVGAVAVPGGQKITPYVTVFLEKRGDTRDFQMAINNDYAKIHRSTRFLVDEAALPGKIYVFGDPLYYHLSGRAPALPIIGWPWRYFLQAQWEQVPGQLRSARPPYIYVDNKSRLMMDKRGGGVGEFIDEYYIRLMDDHGGSWFLLKRKYRGGKSAS